MLRWRPELSTRFLVFRKRDSALVAMPESAPFVADYQANAFEEGGDIVIDCAAYDDISFVNNYLLALSKKDLPRHTPHTSRSPKPWMDFSATLL